MPEIEGVFLTDTEARALAAVFLRLAAQSQSTRLWTSADWAEFGITEHTTARVSHEELAAIQRAVGQYREQQYRDFMERRIRAPKAFIP